MRIPTVWPGVSYVGHIGGHAVGGDMLDMRIHVVMGHAHATLYCLEHRPNHCLWKGSQRVDDDDLVPMVRVLAGAAAAAAQAIAGWQEEGRAPLCGPDQG